MADRINYLPVQQSTMPTRTKVGIVVWSCVNSTLYRWSPKPLLGFRRWLVRLFGGTVAPTASLNNKARIDCPWNLEMGERASIGEFSWVYGLDRIEIGHDACVGQHVFLLTGGHDPDDPGFPLVTSPIRIGVGSWIAARATVLPGVTVGEYAVVAAGSVVTKDVPSMMIAGGNPCKPIRERKLQRTGATA
jgi:putative colanic acid biosynthesis acetyltransferase WcaF